MNERLHGVVLIGFLIFCLSSCGSSNSDTPAARMQPSSNLTLAAAPSTTGIQPVFFGLDIHQIGAGTPWPSIPFGTWSLWDAYVQWPDLEPQRGVWNFTRLDSYVDAAKSHGVQVVYTLGLTPQWASARPDEKCPYGPGEAAEPANFQDWKDYVRTIAMRYKGKISYYIVWNEPDLKYFFTGTIETLLELNKEAYTVLKSIDPNITVLSPAGFRGSLAQGLLDKGDGQFFDVVAAHLYTYPDPAERTVSEVETLSTILQEYGITNKPVWDTEVGWYRTSLSDSDAVAYLCRAMILNAANGLSRFVWYAWDDHNWSKIWLTETDSQTLTPAGVAFDEIEKWLTYRNVQCQSSPLNSAQLWTCSLTSPDGFNGHIVWITAGTLDYQIPASWNASTERKPDGTSALLGADSYTIGSIPTLFDNAQP